MLFNLEKVVICNGQKHMEAFRHYEKNSIMEAIRWLCAYFQENQVLEALNYDIDVPCVVVFSANQPQQ